MIFLTIISFYLILNCLPGWNINKQCNVNLFTYTYNTKNIVELIEDNDIKSSPSLKRIYGIPQRDIINGEREQSKILSTPESKILQNIFCDKSSHSHSE